jgi:hypothetical protein
MIAEGMITEYLWEDTDRENQSTWVETCPIDTLSTKNLTRNGQITELISRIWEAGHP